MLYEKSCWILRYEYNLINKNHTFYKKTIIIIFFSTMIPSIRWIQHPFQATEGFHRRCFRRLLHIQFPSLHGWDFRYMIKIPWSKSWRHNSICKPSHNQFLYKYICLKQIVCVMSLEGYLLFYGVNPCAYFVRVFIYLFYR